MSTVLITGGAGFIGVNTANHFAEKGWRVVLLDNLSRPGGRDNLDWINDRATIEFFEVDIRDAEALAGVVGKIKPDLLLHLAAQVAVTTSVVSPRFDFEVNALGSFNVLEAVRQHSPDSFLVYASTNKVYGKMEDLEVVERNGRYEYLDLSTGVPESRPLDFHSPYGCSKGVADQYVIDYSRIYGLKATSFRQSCIYGTRQFGVEDQGWVAWFTIASVLGRDITIYGDGKQIRDVLFVDDLSRAYEAAYLNQEAASGEAFNIGGGPVNTLSLLELLEKLKERLDSNIPLTWDNWRPGDQPVFVCDLSKAGSRLGWSPQTSADAGVTQLLDWVQENEAILQQLFPSK